MTQIIEVKLSDIGVNKSILVSDVYVKIDDEIKLNDNIIMIETDKASMDFSSPNSGKVVEVLVKVGDKINQGDTILKLISDVKQSFQDESESDNRKKEEVSSRKIDLPQQDFSKVYASPSIRKLARELNVDLNKCIGTGEKNRITEEDVITYLNKQTKQVNVFNNDSLTIDYSKFGEVKIESLPRIKKISGDNLSKNWISIPHVTQFDDADITELEEFRKSINDEYKDSGIKVSILAFLIKANFFALRKFPEFNSSLDGDNIIYKKYFNIGFATDTDQGLVVPVIKDVDKKSILTIAKEISDLSSIARSGKLKLNDMQGGVFTISSLGGIGGTAFTPIINAPEVAILGVSKAIIKPIWFDNKFNPRLILPLSLSYDHRIIDGVLAAKYTTYLSSILKDIRKLLL